jgi:hypothetical protein
MEAKKTENFGVVGLDGRLMLKRILERISIE